MQSFKRSSEARAAEGITPVGLWKGQVMVRLACCGARTTLALTPEGTLCPCCENVIQAHVKQEVDVVPHLATLSGPITRRHH